MEETEVAHPYMSDVQQLQAIYQLALQQAQPLTLRGMLPQSGEAATAQDWWAWQASAAAAADGLSADAEVHFCGAASEASGLDRDRRLLLPGRCMESCVSTKSLGDLMPEPQPPWAFAGPKSCPGSARGRSARAAVAGGLREHSCL